MPVPRQTGQRWRFGFSSIGPIVAGGITNAPTHRRSASITYCGRLAMMTDYRPSQLVKLPFRMRIDMVVPSHRHDRRVNQLGIIDQFVYVNIETHAYNRRLCEVCELGVRLRPAFASRIRPKHARGGVAARVGRVRRECHHQNLSISQAELHHVRRSSYARKSSCSVQQSSSTARSE